MVHLTQHFRDRWSEYGKGPLPRPDDVAQWIAGAVRFQVFRDDLFTVRGRRMKQLAVYWSYAEQIILKVDEGREPARVVTVLTPATKDEPPYDRNGSERHAA